MKLRVGFIGLGLMGNPMAKNILKNGFPLTVYNRTPEKTKEFASLGSEIAASPKTLAENVDVVITMVTAAKDLEEILFSPQGVVAGAKKGLIIIDMSTIGVIAAKKISEQLAAHEIAFLDAPVTGSTPGAINGTLTIFVGGKATVLEKAHEVLSAMGRKVIHMGATGSGQAMKLINNYLLASYMNALSESMLLADGMELPREKVAEVLPQTPNFPPSIQMKLPNFVHNTFPLAFSLANMRKDLGLALLEMQQANEHLPGIVQTEEVYGKANDDKELSQQDFSAIIKQVEKGNR